MDSVIDDEESYCYNERNELTQRSNLLSVTEYIYDENGSLIKEKEGEKETGYRYDLLNRQSHVQLPDGRIQENLYDGEGLRAGLKEGSTISTFLFYNGEILAECNGDSMPIRRHLTGQGLSHVQNLENNTFHAYHQDEQGSTVYVTGTTGETENLYSYDGFGNILESREEITNRILYTGQQCDQETGQYYLRARYYNPVIGRFTQEDTYRGDGLNLYAYCDNNPVMYYDPSGHGCDDNTQTETAPQPVDGVGEGGSGTRVQPSHDPDILAEPTGRRTNINYSDPDVDNIRALIRENEAADTLAKQGYTVEQNPSVPGSKNPDYLIEGEIFDCYSPKDGTNVRNIASGIQNKVDSGQTNRVILNLDDWHGGGGNIDDLISQLNEWPIEGLKEVKIINQYHEVIDIYP